MTIEKTDSLPGKEIAIDHSANEPTREQAETALQNLAFRSRRLDPDSFQPALVPEKPVHLADVAQGVAETDERPRFPTPSWTAKSFWSLFEAAPDGIVIVDPGGTIVLANAQAEKMFGYHRDELHGAAIELLVPERFRAQHLQHRARFFANPHSRPMGLALDLFGRRKNGHEFSVEISLSVLEADECTLVASTIRDVTDRKIGEAFLRKAEARYRTLVEQIPAVTFVAALDGGINDLYVSPQIEELLGFSQKEWLEDPVLWFNRLHPDDRERWHREFAQTCLSGKPFRSIYRFVARDGHVVWVHGEANVFRGEDGQALVLQGVAFDITGMKQAEEELLALNQTLEQRVAERMIESEKRAVELVRSNDALEDFAGVTAHELKEPLRAMKSFAQLLARRYQGQLDATADEFIGRIVNAGSRMEGLISALLDYAHVGRYGAIARVSVGEVISAVCQLLERVLEETDAQLTTHGLDDMVVIGVETELVLLFKNLIGNALKFRGERPVQVHVEGRQEAALWHFSVRDNGIGIAPEYIARLFRMGERLHSRTKFPGHGIGLATCKKIVERHGGEIWIESEPDKGSTFYFTLPTPPR